MDICPNGEVIFCSYVITTCYREYSVYDGVIKETGGNQTPAIIRYKVDSDQGYTLNSYWVPRDGSYYVEDIKEKFPESILGDALDSQKYAAVLTLECDEKAQACQDIMLDMVEDIITEETMNTGQAWVDEFQKLVHTRKEKYK